MAVVLIGAAAIISQLKVTPPTAAGFTSADLIAIVAIMVTIFGLLLTAIGVLVLRSFSGLDARVSQVEDRLGRDIDRIWHSLDGIYQRLWNERVPHQGDYRDQPKDHP
jgi:hypothetical protein